MRDLLLGAHMRMIGTDYVKRCRTLCRFFDWFLVLLGWTLYQRGTLTGTASCGAHSGTRQPIAGLAHRAQLRMRLNCNNLFLIRIANYLLFIVVYYLHSNYCLVFLINAKYFLFVITNTYKPRLVCNCN